MPGAYKHQSLTIILIFLFITPLSVPTLAQPPPIKTQIEHLPNQQEIILPIDTSNPHTRYQPIDIQIDFNTPAWAQNETHHAVRIVYEQAGTKFELESQIYDLNYTDDTHISRCNLVFLIPPDVDGTETYHLLFDTKEIEPPKYPKHVSVVDTHYFYEPISGQKIDFDYYKIMQDNHVIYGVIQKGELLGEGVSHTVVKLKPNSTEFETLNTDQFGNYGMTYNIDGPLQYTGSARATEVIKSILVQGNLMIRVHLKATSPENTVSTDGIYTYYYCPTPHKRIDCNINHEILKKIELGANKQRDAFFGMSTFKARSATIENMNVGDILPTMHAYTENGIIAEYSIPSDPDSEVQEWLLSTTDDIDLGENSWICIDDTSTGKAHGMIVESHTNLVNDEHDGLQVKASVKQVVKLPGLEADTGSLYLTRNSYESGVHSTIIPIGLNITTNCEFFTTETGGFEKVAAEAEIYKKLIAIKPISRSYVTTEPDEEINRYTLTATVHLEPTFPLGAALSAVIGKRFSYLYAELYNDGSIISSGSLARLPLSEGLALDFDNTTLGEKIKLIIGLFDWRNFSPFKRIRFPDIDPGDYLIKIYKENIRRKTQGQYIGFSTVTVTKDTTIHILARPEGAIQLSVKDDANTGLPHAQCILKYQNTIIAETTTNDQGNAILLAPCYNGKTYTLQIFFQGFLLKHTTIKLRARNQFITVQQTVNTPLHLLDLEIIDTWNLPIAIDVNPRLISSDMERPILITASKKLFGYYQFHQLVPATYLIKLDYKSFKTETTLNLNQDVSETIYFPAEYTIKLDLYNTYGQPISAGHLQIQRENEEEHHDITTTNITFSVPPADYIMTIEHDGNRISQQPIEIRSDKTLSIISTEGSLTHTFLIILGLIILLIAAIQITRQHSFKPYFSLIFIGLLIISLGSPWWNLTGDNGQTTTSTNTLIYPPKIVTLTSTATIQGGEIAAVPEVLTTVLTILSIFILVTILFFGIKIMISKDRSRLNTLITILIFIFLILITLLFFIAMQQITEIGVGTIFGSGELDITLPGGIGTDTINCIWGFSTGYYLIILALILYLVISFYHFLLVKQNKKINKKRSLFRLK
jgi:hypothetical protein